MVISPSVLAVLIFIYAFIVWTFYISVINWNDVTPDLTWRTLIAHSRLAVEQYAGRVVALQREFTQSERLVPVSQELRASLERDLASVAVSALQATRFEGEPYAMKLAIIESRLRATLACLDALEAAGQAGAGAME